MIMTELAHIGLDLLLLYAAGLAVMIFGALLLLFVAIVSWDNEVLSVQEMLWLLAWTPLYPVALVIFFREEVW